MTIDHIRSRKEKENRRLTRIMVFLVVVGVLGYGGYHLVHWFSVRFASSYGDATAFADLETARELIAAARNEEARTILEPIAESAHDATAPDALLLLARLDQQSEEHQAALAKLSRAMDEFPNAPIRPQITVAYARSLEEIGKMDEAARLYRHVVDTAPPDLRPAAFTGLGRMTEHEGDLVKACEHYQRAVQQAEWDSSEWQEAVDMLGRANVKLIFSPVPTPDSREYVVQSGDNLLAVGVKLNTTQGLLILANNIEDPASLRVGQRLKYTPKDFRIVIERSTCRLFLFDKDGLFKCYPVGLGMPGHETTLGAYKIGTKEKDPAWWKPGVGHIPPGDPANELGTRWMPLVPTQDGLPADLGIHGTVDPETIGGYTSHGCTRMFRADVEELYDLVVRSTPVDIVERYDPQAGS
jgi:tetratricopeptide (TPR) repeat protein